MSNLKRELEDAAMALESAADMLQEWGDYADPYFQKKHALDADIAYVKSHAKRAIDFLVANKFSHFTETGLEPPGCPAPGGCACPIVTPIVVTPIVSP